METLRDQLQTIIKANFDSAAERNIEPSSQSFYAALNKEIKKEHPEHFTKALDFAKLNTLTTCRGVRTAHYITFNFDEMEFTTNQKTKIDNHYLGGSPMHDPWIGRMPSKAEQLFYTAWVMANIDSENGEIKTYQ